MNKTVLLGEIGRVITGKTPPKAKPEYWGNELDFITPTDFKDSKYIKPARKLSITGQQAMQRLVCPANSVIVTCIGSDMGKVALAMNPFVSNQQINTLIVDSDKADPSFIYYLLKMNRPLLRKYAESGGSTMPIINKSTFERLPFDIPDLETQEKIADILGTIDEKIELNRRMNETLEQMGQALFRHHFITNPEVKNWPTGKLDDLFSITMGQSPPGSSYNEAGEGIVFYQGRAEFGIRFPKQRLSTTDPKRMAKKGDVLLSVRAPVGDINQATENCCVGRGLAAISSRDSLASFCYYFIKNMQPRFSDFNSEGTVFGAINGRQLNGLAVALPPLALRKLFNEEAEPLDGQIWKNSEEIQTLTTLRDTLLPRLIGGKITV